MGGVFKVDEADATYAMLIFGISGRPAVLHSPSKGASNPMDVLQAAYIIAYHKGLKHSTGNLARPRPSRSTSLESDTTLGIIYRPG